MFSKEESAIIRQEFWTTFGQTYPRKWLLYNTKIKGFAFKFQGDRKTASVCLDFEHLDDIANELLYDKLLSLKNILETEYLPEVIYHEKFELDNRKIIRRIYVPYDKKFSIHNKNTWQDCYEFYIKTMDQFEMFFYEYEDIIRDAI